MLVKKDKEKIKKKFLKGKIDEIEVIRTMVYADKELLLEQIINESLYALLTAKLKRLFSIVESTLAITAVELITKFELNIANKKIYR